MSRTRKELDANMASMAPSRKEVEIKLAFDCPKAAETRLERHGAVLVQTREFEDKDGHQGRKHKNCWS